ncbi:hypothetical protein SAMN05428988_3239 [Chitinophaga sp. YR573]|uniref:DUF7695 domain-containing protein n=1 Tax=Chitinophaga sp. YR573 TaxID=1881040 RepID=UPI0008BB2C85|nr:hypothetical protein [Chitinophaga sp. YR573]SEW21704.1 hypothetical protein SAMN05428988_3239 [Chitinophaga sp. YR573]
MLVYNAARCLKCGMVVESKYRHEAKTCGCSNKTTVDGGLHYQQFSGVDINLIQPISLHVWDDYETVREYGFVLKALKEGKLMVLRLKDIKTAWLDKAISWLMTNMPMKRTRVLVMLIREKQYRMELEA